MPANRQRLDRFVSVTLGVNRRDVKIFIAQTRIHIDGTPAHSVDQLIDAFSRIVVDGQVLQDKKPVYLMMNKPVGILSATKDSHHTTVVDLLDHLQRAELHIVGRLDRSSTGLLLLSNDGRWSQAVMAPENHVDKTYIVTLKNPITAQNRQEYVDAFAAGMHFPFEDITTLPAKLEILERNIARVTLSEGRYHQIKRMFGRFRNPVIGLHRIKIGRVLLDSALDPGQSRALSAMEVLAATSSH